MRTRFVAITSSVALTLGLIALPAAAQASSTTAASTGTVSVQLVTPWGTPLALKGIYVNASTKSSPGGTTAITNAKGIAVFSKQRPGTVTVVPHAPHGSAYTFPSTKVVKVASGKKVSVKLTGAVGAAITGTVTADSATGRLVDNAVVAAIPVGKTPGQAGVYTETARNGKYSLQGLANGTYKVLFEPPTDAPALKNYIYSYWKSAPNFAGAQTITVRNQTATTPPISARNVNNILTIGKTLTVELDPTVVAAIGKSDYVDFVLAVRNTSSVDDVSLTGVAGATSFTTKLVPGTFLVAVNAEGTSWYYAGEGEPATTDKSKAAVVAFNGAGNTTIHIGPAN